MTLLSMSVDGDEQPTPNAQVPLTALKAVESEGASESTRRRAAAFERALTAHLTKLIDEPGVYGRLGLAEVFELREECLR